MIAAITGASRGIGREVAGSLQKLDYRIIFIGRDQSRYDGSIRGQDLFVECELASLRSVAAGAAFIKARFDRIDLLINNAGVAGRRGVTEDGYELAFGVNYLSHFLLTRALPNIGRIVNVSSEAHRPVRNLDPQLGVGRTRSLAGWREYQFSKAAQIAFTCSLAVRGFDAYSAHPGVIGTDLWRRIPQPFRALLLRSMQPPAIGAIPILRASTDDSLRPGDYVTPAGVIAPNPAVIDPSVTERLWQQSLNWVAAHS